MVEQGKEPKSKEINEEMQFEKDRKNLGEFQRFKALQRYLPRQWILGFYTLLPSGTKGICPAPPVWLDNTTVQGVLCQFLDKRTGIPSERILVGVSWVDSVSQLLLPQRTLLLLFSHEVMSDSCDPMDCGPPGSSVHGKNTGVCCRFLLQGIFPTQGLNLHLLYWQPDSLPLSHEGSPQRM